MKDGLRTRLRSSRDVQILKKARHAGELGAYITGTYATSDATSMGQKGQDLQEEVFLGIRLMVGCLNLKLLGTSTPWPLLIPPAVSCTVLIIPPLDLYIQLIVSFPDPPRKNRERVWQHIWQCHVQEEFNQLHNHV